MKITYRIPSKDPYGYLEFEVEKKDGLTSNEMDTAIDDLERMMEYHKNGKTVSTGLSSKDWNTALDSYINGNPMAPDTYYAMSPEQQKIIQELKKCFKRLKSKESDVIAGVDFGKSIDLLEDL